MSLIQGDEYKCGSRRRREKNSPEVMRTVMGKKRLKETNAEVKREKRGKSHAFDRSEEQEDDDDAARPGDDADEDQTSLADGEKWNNFTEEVGGGVGEGRDGRRRMGGIEGRKQMSGSARFMFIMF